MPKRLIDGDALWQSSRLAKVEAAWRAEYANLLPLALANGVFECDPRRVWTLVYAFNRNTTENQVVEILEAFERAGMLFRWMHQDGKQWGYFLGIDKPGRLPAVSQRGRYACGPEPPAQALSDYVRSHSGLDPGYVRSHSGVDPESVQPGLDRKGLAREGETISSAGADFQRESPSVSSSSTAEPVRESKPDTPESTTATTNLGGTQAEPTPATRVQPEDLLAFWRQHRGSLPDVRELSPDRKRKCRARLEAHAGDVEEFLSDWAQAVQKAAQTAFLRGDGPRGWRASFDWFIANDTNYAKVLEGSYDTPQRRSTSKNLDAAAEFIRRTTGEMDGVSGECPEPDNRRGQNRRLPQ